MRLKKSIVNMGGSTYTAVQFNYAPPKDKKIIAGKLYFIHAFDKEENPDSKFEEIVNKIMEMVNILENEKLLTLIGLTGDLKRLNQQNSLVKLENVLWGKPDKLTNELNDYITPIEIQCEGKSILNFTRNEINFHKGNLKVFPKGNSKNKIYIINPGEEEFEFKINGEIFNSTNIKSKLTPMDIESLLYAGAYFQYRIGNSRKALDILRRSLRDKYLTKTVVEAFTAEERINCLNLLSSAVHNRKISIQPKIWGEPRFMEGKIEDEVFEPKVCLMDLLDMFETNGDKFIPAPSEEYKRIGREVIDNYNVFREDKSVIITGSFKDLVYTKDRLNISIKYKIPGCILINPRQAKSVGFDSNTFSAAIYREQTIIKDGAINLEKWSLLVSEKTLDFLKSLEIANLFMVEENNKFYFPNYALVTLNVSDLPLYVAGCTAEEDNLNYILNLCYDKKAAECKRKVLKYFIENYNCNGNYSNFKYTKEQYDLLKSYGLTFDGIYEGIENKEINNRTERYECRFLEFELKGFSSIPKVEDLILKMKCEINKFNGPELIMSNYISYLKENKSTKSVDRLIKLLEEQKQIIKTNTKILARIKLYKITTGGWWQGLKTDCKGNYLYQDKDKTLIIKANRKIVEI